MIRRIIAVVIKEFREILRDPILVGTCLLLPLVMLFLFGYAVNLDVESVSLGVLDLDKTTRSRALIDRFAQSGYFQLDRSYQQPGDLKPSLMKGEVDGVLVIPENFQDRWAKGTKSPVQFILDGVYAAKARIVSSYAQAIIDGFGIPPTRSFDVETRVWFNPSLRSINFIVPGLYGVILMAFPPLLTTLGIVREKETGSIQQMFVSPLTGAEFIAGKLIPFGLIAFGEMMMVILVGHLWFSVPFLGNIGFFLGVSLLYVFCTVSLGLLVSTLTRSQLVAMLLVLILTLMPSFLFSGFLFPIFSMPWILQLYTRLFPARYFLELSRNVVLKGSGLSVGWVNVLLLGLYTLAVFLLAVYRFRKKVA